MLLHTQAVSAQEPEKNEVSAAVDQGVAYLVQQAREDGSISRQARHSTAMTSLSIMALTAVGHQPTDNTPQGKLLRNALEFVLGEERQTKEGYFGKADNSRMYGHGITALMLCEMLGMGVDEAQDKKIRECAERALNLILQSQSVRKHNDKYKGGWRYEPNSNDADLSVTVWQVMALRAGKAAGINVPTSAIDQAVAYLERSFKEQGQGMGGFGYEPGQGPGYATTSAGLLAMQVCGKYEHEQVASAAQYLREKKLNREEKWFYYGTYYYSIGMYQAAEDDEQRELAAAQVWKELSESQNKDGSWTGKSQESDQIYATSLAILALSVQYHYLPIYQR
jgi:hypothetical protein